MIKKLLFIGLTLFSSHAWSYPNFIGFGYNACLTCHYNPYGNGPLTDYGRALSANAISDRLIHSDSKSEEEIATNSGFLYSKPKNQWLRPSIDYRGLYLKSNYQTDTEDSKIIHMDANLNLVFRLGPKENKDKFIAVGTVGYAPAPLSNQDSTEPKYRSREHYLGYRMNDKWGVYGGLMDKIFGLRIPDHITYSRIAPAVSQNDQTHGVLLHYTKPVLDFGVQAYVGNMAQDANLRQKGIATQAEYSVTDNTRIGGSLFNSKSIFLKTYGMAFHSRSRFGKGSSIMAEVGQVNKSAVSGSSDIDSRYWLIQNHIKASRGLYIINTIEYFKANIKKKEDKSIRFGPGLQYFPGQGLELRTDLYNTRVFSEESVSDDTWDITGQLHLWF
ncbi:MAG: hypothetical protein HN509_03215 [Halobacteriovoraceae bacterium]|jgi:hypothetical protein|nr:hypothetical protein [Halobacteriovoraceae bacterium]MBT5094745.1 hypothetical protein [Halobacteriovoraceae bacterium]